MIEAEKKQLNYSRQKYKINFFSVKYRLLSMLRVHWICENYWLGYITNIRNPEKVTDFSNSLGNNNPQIRKMSAISKFQFQSKKGVKNMYTQKVHSFFRAFTVVFNSVITPSTQSPPCHRTLFHSRMILALELHTE